MEFLRENPINKVVASVLLLVCVGLAGCETSGGDASQTVSDASKSVVVESETTGGQSETSATESQTTSDGSESAVVEDEATGGQGETSVIESETTTDEAETANGQSEPIDHLAGWTQLDISSNGIATVTELPPLTAQFVDIDLARESPFLLDGQPPRFGFSRDCLTGSSQVFDTQFERDAAELGDNVEITTATFLLTEDIRVGQVTSGVDSVLAQLTDELGSSTAQTAAPPGVIEGDGFRIYVALDPIQDPPASDAPTDIYWKLEVKLLQPHDDSFCERARPWPATYAPAIEDGLADRSMTLTAAWSHTVLHPDPAGEFEREYLVLDVGDNGGRANFIDPTTQLNDEVDLTFTNEVVSMTRKSRT